MPLDWKIYDSYFHSPGCDQTPLGAEEKIELEERVAGYLQISMKDLGAIWGRCSHPGVNALTVIRIPIEIRHIHSDLARNRAIGVKIFRSSGGIGGDGPRWVHFHLQQRPDLPGVNGNSHIQKVLAGEMIGSNASLIQEWIEGVTWDEFFGRDAALVSPDTAKKLLEDLFLEIVIPLWGAGVVWWDVRGANYVVENSENRKQLVMIDTDVLQNYAEEIFKNPNDHSKRDKGQITAAKRFKTMVITASNAVLRNFELPKKESSKKKKLAEEIIGEGLELIKSPRVDENFSRAASERLNQMINRLKNEVWSLGG
jgi:hypothetical protein